MKQKVSLSLVLFLALTGVGNTGTNSPALPTDTNTSPSTYTMHPVGSDGDLVRIQHGLDSSSYSFRCIPETTGTTTTFRVVECLSGSCNKTGVINHPVEDGLIPSHFYPNYSGVEGGSNDVVFVCKSGEHGPIGFVKLCQPSVFHYVDQKLKWPSPAPTDSVNTLNGLRDMLRNRGL